MNKLYKIFVATLFGLGFFAAPSFTFAQNPATAPVTATEMVSSFATDVTINQDSSINVVETIDYNFGTTEHHGIYRYIPYKYKARGGNYSLRISDIKVTNEKDEPEQFTQSNTGGKVYLQIGDPDSLVTGAHTYKLSYSVKRALNYFSDHDELYWNVLGSGWTVPIANSEAVIHSPANITRMTCYTGANQTQEQNCSITGGNTSLVTFDYAKITNPGEVFTIVVGMPPGSVAKPTTLQKAWDTFIDNGILLLPIFVFAAMFYLWRRFGKDAKSKNPIVAQYEAPDKLSAMYMGTLLHGKTENQDISAEVVYLAQQGFLTIKRLETTTIKIFKGTDYEFTRTDKSSDSLAPQTNALLEKLFISSSPNETMTQTSKLSDLKKDQSFGTGLMTIKSLVIAELVRMGYWRHSPLMAKSLPVVFGLFVAVAGSVFISVTLGSIGIIATVLSGIIIIIFGLLMAAYTQKGVDTVNYIKGLKLYLTVAEKDRLAFANAPEKDPQQFEKLLPYAIALGVEAQWAEQFKDLSSAPSWYNDSTGGAFNAILFTSSINDFSSSMQSVASSVTSASSGGSGFSGGGGGGGFGGGGGGSW